MEPDKSKEAAKQPMEVETGDLIDPRELVSSDDEVDYSMEPKFYDPDLDYVTLWSPSSMIPTWTMFMIDQVRSFFSELGIFMDHASMLTDHVVELNKKPLICSSKLRNA